MKGLARGIDAAHSKLEREFKKEAKERELDRIKRLRNQQPPTPAFDVFDPGPSPFGPVLTVDDDDDSPLEDAMLSLSSGEPLFGLSDDD